MTQAEREQDRRRIAELTAQLQSARNRIAALEHRLLAMPQAADMTRVAAGLCTMPTPAELKALQSIVVGSHPCLRNNQIGFEQAFRFAATQLTPCEPGRYSRYANATLLDRCTTWLAARGLPNEVSLTAFVAAVLSFNVDSTLDDGRFPYDLDLAVHEGGDGMREAGWRAVLAGDMRAPSKISRPLVKQVQQLNLMHNS